MADHLVCSVLARIRSQPGCSLEDLRDLVPATYRQTGTWELMFLRNPLAPLVHWGVIDARQDHIRLNSAELASQRPGSFEITRIRFYISAGAASLEEALGYNFWVHGDSIFGPPATGIWPEVFVLMPFADDLAPVYHDHIRTVATELGLTIGRADDFFGPKNVIHEIWSAIHGARIVLADCTGRNANVFYEIGIAHTLAKNVILMTQDLNDIPFDLRHLRVVVYDFKPRGMKRFEATLRATLQATMASAPWLFSASSG